MTPPSISIAMATYNGASYLEELLESIDQQILPPFELVVSDDGSTDDTVKIVEAFSKSAKFPTRLLIQKRRRGFRQNFLTAAAACRGDIVSFCDQDDVWHPRKLETVSRVMAEEPDVLLCFHNSMIVDRNRVALQLFFPDAPCTARVDPLTLNPQFRPLGYSQSFRADLLKLIPCCEKTGDWLDKQELAAHDVFFFCLASSIGRIAYLDQPLVEYRQHAGNAFGVSTAPPKPKSFAGLGELFQNATPVLRRYGAISLEYAAAAREFGRVSEFAPEGVIDNAVRSWNLLSRAYRLRSDVQGGRGLFSRCRAFHRLYRLGCYGEKGFWTVGKRAQIHDLVAGVLFGSLVTRVGREAFTDANMRKSRRRNSAAGLASGFPAH